MVLIGLGTPRPAARSSTCEPVRAMSWTSSPVWVGSSQADVFSASAYPSRAANDVNRFAAAVAGLRALLFS
ncbi:hypothetical protein PJI17_22550 [Mycobacterium kansasii]